HIGQAPRVRVASADDESPAATAVRFVHGEACGITGGYAGLPEEQHGRGGKVLAVTRALAQQKRGKRRLAGRCLGIGAQVESVLKVSVEKPGNRVELFGRAE